MQEPLKNGMVCQIVTPWTSCSEAQLQRGKLHFCTSGQIPKATTEGFGDFVNGIEFVDP